MKSLQVGDEVRIDTDHAEWGRVVGTARVLEVYPGAALVNAHTIRANIIVPNEDLAPRSSVAYTILTPTLIDGAIIAWVTEGGKPCTWPTREAAQAELDAATADSLAQIAAGLRDVEDGVITDGDWVERVLVLDDGALEVPALQVVWTLADIRIQHGIDQEEVNG